MDGMKIKFDFRTIKRDVLRHWPIWVLGCVIYLFLVCFANITIRNYGTDISVETVSSYYILWSLVETTQFLAFIMGLVAAGASFGFLTKKKKDYFYEALPFNRLSLFVNRFIFGLILCLIPCIFTVLIEFIQMPVSGFFLIFEWFIFAFCLYLFWYSFAVLFFVVCGRIVMAGFCYFGFSFAGLLISFVLDIYNEVCFIGYSFGSGFLYSIFGIASPLEYTFSIGLDSLSDLMKQELKWHLINSDSIKTVLVILFAGILLLIGSVILFRKRKSEKTGDNVVFKTMKTIFSYAFSFVISISLTLIIMFMTIYNNDQIAHRTSDRLGLIIILCIVGFITFIVSIMIVEKKFKIFNASNMLKTVIFTVVLGLLGIAYLHDAFNIEHYVPELNKIIYVNINTTEKLFTGKNDFQSIHDETVKEKITDIHELILDNMDELEKYSYGTTSNSFGFAGSLVDLREAGVKTDYYMFNMTYHLKNDESITRRYKIIKGSALDTKIKEYIEKNEQLFNEALKIDKEQQVYYD